MLSIYEKIEVVFHLQVCTRETLRSLRETLCSLRETLRSIDTSGHFFHTCLQSQIKTSPPTPQKSYLNVWNHRTTFEIFQK
jgi:hypothetical protein